MKFYLISDDRDTLTGMHLAGIDGEYVDSYENAQKALEKAVKYENVGIIVITDKIAKNCAETVAQIKIDSSSPLLVEIPDSSGQTRPADSIMKIVQEAIGI